MEHEFQPGDTPTAGLYTVPDGRNPGYLCVYSLFIDFYILLHCIVTFG